MFMKPKDSSSRTTFSAWINPVFTPLLVLGRNFRNYCVNLIFYIRVVY
jgi:hypothetical protein